MSYWDLPRIRLTSFLDGAPPHRDEAIYFQQYLQYYEYDEFLDGRGNAHAHPLRAPVLAPA